MVRYFSGGGLVWDAEDASLRLISVHGQRKSFDAKRSELVGGLVQLTRPFLVSCVAALQKHLGACIILYPGLKLCKPKKAMKEGSHESPSRYTFETPWKASNLMPSALTMIKSTDHPDKLMARLRLHGFGLLLAGLSLPVWIFVRLLSSHDSCNFSCFSGTTGLTSLNGL